MPLIWVLDSKWFKIGVVIWEILIMFLSSKLLLCFTGKELFDVLAISLQILVTIFGLTIVAHVFILEKLTSDGERDESRIDLSETLSSTYKNLLKRISKFVLITMFLSFSSLLMVIKSQNIIANFCFLSSMSFIFFSVFIIIEYVFQLFDTDKMILEAYAYMFKDEKFGEDKNLVKMLKLYNEIEKVIIDKTNNILESEKYNKRVTNLGQCLRILVAEGVINEELYDMVITLRMFKNIALNTKEVKVSEEKYNLYIKLKHLLDVEFELFKRAEENKKKKEDTQEK
jgi:hypothetical protein